MSSHFRIYQLPIPVWFVQQTLRQHNCHYHHHNYHLETMIFLHYLNLVLVLFLSLLINQVLLLIQCLILKLLHAHNLLFNNLLLKNINLLEQKRNTAAENPDSHTNQWQSQNVDTPQSEQLVFTQPRDPNIEKIPAYKNFAHTAIEQAIPVQLFPENGEMMKTNAPPMQYLNLLNIPLYNTSVLFLGITISLIKLIRDLLNIQMDIAVEVHHIIVK